MTEPDFNLGKPDEDLQYVRTVYINRLQEIEMELQRRNKKYERRNKKEIEK